jgi:hypothetical protein
MLPFSEQTALGGPLGERIGSNRINNFIWSRRTCSSGGLQLGKPRGKIRVAVAFGRSEQVALSALADASSVPGRERDSNSRHHSLSLSEVGGSCTAMPRATPRHSFGFLRTPSPPSPLAQHLRNSHSDPDHFLHLPLSFLRTKISALSSLRIDYPTLNRQAPLPSVKGHTLRSIALSRRRHHVCRIRANGTGLPSYVQDGAIMGCETSAHHPQAPFIEKLLRYFGYATTTAIQLPLR